MNSASRNPARAGGQIRVASQELLVPNPKLRLREQLREVMRFKHYSLRTETTYRKGVRDT